MKLIVGLGNPGEQYKNTRHNLGFMVLDEMVKESWEESKKFKSLIAKTRDIIFVKPQTYMNNSGLAINLLTVYYKLPATDLIVIYDELDLPLGKIRVKKGGSSAGHHGLESIINVLKTDQFQRVRLGIGPAKISPEKFVLESFASFEKPLVKKMIKEAISAIDRVLLSPLD